MHNNNFINVILSRGTTPEKSLNLQRLPRSITDLLIESNGNSVKVELSSVLFSFGKDIVSSSSSSIVTLTVCVFFSVLREAARRALQ